MSLPKNVKIVKIHILSGLQKRVDKQIHTLIVPICSCALGSFFQVESKHSNGAFRETASANANFT